MVRQPCCDKGVKKGAWTPEEDRILVDYITKNGHGTWRKLPEKAGLLRCGKSCRLRYINYLRSDIKRGPFTPEEVTTIIRLHGVIGNRWAYIASQLKGRTDNEIKNFWNTHLKKQLPATNQLTSQSPFSSSKTVDLTSECSSTSHVVQCESAKAITSMHAFPSPEVKPCSDYIPNLWNSVVREPFGKIKDEAGVTIQQPKKETASPSKVESESVITTQAESAGTTLTLPDTAYKEKEMLPATSKNEKDVAALNSSQSYDLDMDLLLDIPGCNYLDFLRETYGVSFY